MTKIQGIVLNGHSSCAFKLQTVLLTWTVRMLLGVWARHHSVVWAGVPPVWIPFLSEEKYQRFIQSYMHVACKKSNFNVRFLVVFVFVTVISGNSSHCMTHTLLVGPEKRDQYLL